MNTIDIFCELQEINNITNSMTITGFIFSINDKNYIISTHHGLPIKRCYLPSDTINTLTIYSNPIWNELLILESKYEINNLKVNKKFKSKFPKNGDELIIKNNNINIKLEYSNEIFMHLNSLKTNPLLPYIKANIVDGSIERSYSGSPVFSENNFLVGIFTKLNVDKNSVYIVPVYILIKTLIKKYNDGIFDILCNENILKVNSINIKNQLINHKNMNINMPITTYFMIEGDENNSELINNTEINYTNINKYMCLNNCTKLIKNKNNYELSARLFKLIQIFYTDIYFDVDDIIDKHYKNKIQVMINVKKPKGIIPYYELKTSNNENFKFIISDATSLV